MEKETKIYYPKDGIYGTLMLLNEDGTLRWKLNVITVLQKLKNGQLRLKYGVAEREGDRKNTVFSYEYGPKNESLSPLAKTPAGAITKFLNIEKLLIDSL